MTEDINTSHTEISTIILTVANISKHDPELVDRIAAHLNEILILLGENPMREGLAKTPVRAAKALLDITAGYKSNPLDIARQAIFNHCGSKMVIVRDIEFYSTCEHHILPFFGKISVGYLPKGRILGLSKLARVVDGYARRLQVQERLTAQVCHTINDALPNDGVIVWCEAQHLCMKARGVEKQESVTTTLEYSGQFETNPALRAEFLGLIQR